MKTNKTIRITGNCGLAALALLMAGCASGPRFSEYRGCVPSHSEGGSRVWFYRPAGAFGVTVQPPIMLDDRKVGTAVPRGFFCVEASPGTHEVSATTEWTHRTQITVNTNADTFVRLNMMVGVFMGHVIPHEVPEAKATNQMNNLRLADKPTWIGKGQIMKPLLSRLGD